MRDAASYEEANSLARRLHRFRMLSKPMWGRGGWRLQFLARWNIPYAMLTVKEFGEDLRGGGVVRLVPPAQPEHQRFV